MIPRCTIYRPRQALIGTLLAGFFLSACSAGGTTDVASSRTLANPDAVVDAMNEAGIKCVNLQLLRLDEPKPTITAGSCTLFTESGEWAGSVKIMTSTKSSDELYAAEAAFYHQPDITAMTTFPIWIAQGDGWTVSCGTGQDQAERIAVALGGKAVSIAG
ncbi:hypothetical protein GCM10027187_40320 [Streptosporangium sandarakinum]|uniref:DUF3558 domain-containing protein n=1 Tax=Streptosporangium sandarakinum TaxID=1260955 RepID=A0A852V485_9ACTN|nr:hypothetical protein [Streptosporangium sandarakinum]NYF44637.1 hypothetical protein [Streptosporangium sandarakinum]